MLRDRLSWMRFLGFELGGPTPDENTIRHFRNRLTETGTLKRVMKAFDRQLQKKGYIPMSGQIVDASLAPAPKQRNTEDEKAAVKAGKSAKEIWPNEPNKAVQKDVDARWTLKIGGKGRFLGNIFVERLWRLMEYEYVYLHAWETGSQAKAGIKNGWSSTITSALIKRLAANQPPWFIGGEMK